MDDIADSFEETVHLQHDNQGKGKGKGGGRGHGRGGGGGSGNRDMLLSKALSKLLRHQAVSAGIQLDREGYAALDKVVSLLSRGVLDDEWSVCGKVR
jgi:2'-phosphotransferase